MAGMRATGLPAARAGRVGFPFAKPFLEVLRGLYRILHAIVGRARGREVRASGCAFFLLVLFGVFDVPQIRAEWGDVDRTKFDELSGQVSQGTTYLGAIKESNSSIHEILNNRLPTLQSLLQTLSADTQSGFSDVSAVLVQLRDAVGYGNSNGNVNTQLGTVVSKLEAIRSALSSSSGISQQELKETLQTVVVGLTSPYFNPRNSYYWETMANGNFVRRTEGYNDLATLITTIPRQSYESARFLQYWNGKNFDNVTTRLDDIISKMGTGGGGGSDLSNIEQYLQTLNGYLMGDSSSSGMYGMYTTVSKPMGGFTFKQLLADSIRKQPESLYVALRNLSSMNSQGFSYLSDNLYSLGQLMASMDYQQTLSEMRDLLMEIADNTKSGSSSGGGGGLTSEELDAILSKYFGFPASGGQSFYASRLDDVDINGVRFSSAIVTPTGSPKDLVSALFYMNNVLGNFLNNNSRNQLAFSRLFWKAIMGSSGSSTSDLVRDGFVSYSFGDSPAFYPDGKPWRQYTESKFWSPSSLLEALALINMNLARFSNVQSKNMYALGDQNYWATTNIISHLNPETYWGEKKDDGKDSDYIYRFGEGADGSTDGKPFNPTNYSPTISQAYTNYTNTIMADTNRLDVVENDKVLQKYFLEAAFKADGSSATIQFEGTDSDWGNIEITLPTFGGARGNGPTFTLELKKGWAEIKPQAAVMLNNWLRPVCVAVWWFFGGFACFVMVRKVGGI